ncbi:TAP-like protein [Saccharopolyspora kobensis]|uniref:TAP-like protein n=1 Tax=Saccharopolyspora kobensis TaxID=146035 RepID=A0A1H6E5Y2_9PSEU|nr:alpha/beta fold hydrolase [Saccharopolyspora kobensis]SEG92295.1 TAP-like protein [Saccharopolyspora kobensis]SFD36539.1 TAP-like protein [Saccharopolyspora kobensis]
MKRAITVVAAALCLSGCATATAERQLAWQPCAGEDDPGGYECAEVEVPVDWDAPHGAKLSLRIARLPSTDPAQRIGSVVFNPGGPGASGIEDLKAGADNVAELRTRFDVVTWEPRGSWPTWSQAQEEACVMTGPEFTFPRSQAEFDAKAAENAAQADRCRELAPGLYDNMDSASHARDLDAIREALGEEELNYFGQSYGGVIGVSYARLFPQQVRTMFLDSIVNHTASDERADELRALERTDLFNRFVDWCGETESCSMRGEDVRAVWRDLLVEADRAPIPVAGTELAYSAFDLENAMQPFLGVSRYTELDQAIAAARNGDATVFTMPSQGRKPWHPNAMLATQCADGFTYRTYEDFEAAAERARRLTPDFPHALPGLQTTCLGWEVTNPRGPLDGENLPPILGASGANELLTTREVVSHVPGSTVIEFPGVYHGLYMAAGNRCVIDHVNRYFTDATLPPEGTVCEA